MKRFSSMILLVAMLASLAACGSDAPAADGTTAAADTTTEAVTEKPYLDNLPEMDFDGAGFHMLIRTTRKTQLVADEENGDLLNDAVYKRNRSIEERFNVKMTYHELADTSGDWHSAIDGDVLSGSGEYDVVMPDYWWGCETRGNFLNLLDYSEYIDFDAPWWVSGWNDNATIYGQLYNAVGSACLDVVRNMECVFFNKKLQEDLKLEDIYALVDDGKWTYDKFAAMVKSAGSDLNGDSEYKVEDDRFGAISNTWSLRGLLVSGGISCSKKSADGSFELTQPDERFVECYDKVFDIVHNESGYLQIDGSGVYNAEWSGNVAFNGDRVLFLLTAFRGTEVLRDMKSDFGIVPMPKLDEKQKDYIGYNLGTYFLSVPLTAKDPVKSAVILEAMNAESYKSVVPTYYESMLKVKYSRDERTAEMLDLILNSTYFDFAFVNESATSSIVMSIAGTLTSGNDAIMSAYESKLTSARAGLENLLEKYKENMK